MQLSIADAGGGMSPRTFIRPKSVCVGSWEVGPRSLDLSAATDLGERWVEGDVWSARVLDGGEKRDGRGEVRRNAAWDIVLCSWVWRARRVEHHIRVG